MNAWIIAVGSELLTPFRLDTNSLVIAERLNAVGFDVRRKVVVGDHVGELSEVMTAAIAAADLVVCTGGLGPTEDDLTREAVAQVLSLPLDTDEGVAEGIRQRFERYRIQMPAINRRQALVPRGALVLDNANGTAPGLWVPAGASAILLLPGPPREMLPILDEVIRTQLASRSGGAGLFRRVLKITGRSESDVDATAQPVYGTFLEQDVPIVTTILAVSGQIELHLSAQCSSRDQADAVLSPAVESLRACLGESVYSVDGRSIEAVVGDLLRDRSLTLALAESCTGGLLASRLTDVPGSSAFMMGGFVCYSNRSKIEWLGVPEALIADHGAVSEPVAQAMAAGARDRAAASIGVGITGIAGPDGGTPEKPVGTVAIAISASPDAGGDRVRLFTLRGGRELVKFQSATAALNMLRLQLG